MKPGRLVCTKVGSTLLALGVLAASANAGTGFCTTPFPDCGTHQCGRSGHHAVACYLRISKPGSNVTVTAQDSMDGGDVCVAFGTKIKWFTSDSGSNFMVNFAQNPFAHPTTSASFSGNDGDDPQGGKASHLPSSLPKTADTCYQYSVTYTASGSSASLDPNVIVKGVHFLRPEAKAHSEPSRNK
jgi:hypothetical protein